MLLEIRTVYKIKYTERAHRGMSTGRLPPLYSLSGDGTVEDEVSSGSLKPGSRLVAALWLYPRTDDLFGNWAKGEFDRSAHFIKTVNDIRHNTKYPENYSEIYNLKEFNHWHHTKVVPVDVLSHELKTAKVRLQAAAPPSVVKDKGYYIRRDFSEKRIFVLGDSHGSLHSMLDIFVFMSDDGAFDDKPDKCGVLRLRSGVVVVCTGDLLDRSPYGLDCIYLMLRLQRENPESVVFTAGNHEIHRPQWSAMSGSSWEMWGEYDNKVHEKRGRFITSGDMGDALYGVTSLLPASLIAKTAIGVVQFNHGSFEDFTTEQLNAFKQFTTFKSEESTFETAGTFQSNRLQWGDLVTTEINLAFLSLGRPQTTAKELQVYLKSAGLRMLIRGHSDMANLSLVFGNQDKPSYKLQAEDSVQRKDSETWNYMGHQVTDSRSPIAMHRGGTFVKNVETMHHKALYDMYTLEPSSGMGDFKKHLVTRDDPNESLLAVTLSSCPFSKQELPVCTMSAYLLLE